MQVAAAMVPNQLLQAGSIELFSREHPTPNYIRSAPLLEARER